MADLFLRQSPGFPTTQWNSVLLAGQTPTAESRSALSDLYERYWQPLYFHVRHRGYAEEEAEDLVQDFFVHLLDKGMLLKADRERGRFRTFLLACLRYFLTDEWDKRQALKRGGGAQRLSLDVVEAEKRYRKQMEQAPSPELLFERQFAMKLLDRALGRLRAECEANDKSALFESLKEYLANGRSAGSYRQKAETLGISEVSVRVTVHRLRKRLGELLRQEIADTVADANDIEDEIRHLIGVLG